MTSPLTQAHRPRSLSASTSSPRSRRSPDHILPTKRPYPSNFAHDAYFVQALDADTWRQKKRRRDHSPLLESTSRSTMLPTSSFASTPAEFQLPKRVHDVQRPRSSTTPPFDSFSFGFSAPEPESHDLAALSSLRSNAFGELHRTVVESGEGLIQRMRDYELSRSKSDVYLKVAKYPERGRKQLPPGVLPQKTTSQRRQVTNGEDDDDEVQILIPQMTFPGSSGHKKRAVSLGPGDFLSSSTGSERCSSPIFYPSFVSHSDDESHVSSGRPSSLACSLFSSPLPTSSTPALSHTLSNSTNSSLVSLVLPPPIPHNPHQPPRPGLTSRSEKAIAALTLAMANGAGDLNDYQALLAIQAPPALDNSQVGEMWH
ncbi:hypothetical protein L208DRAFT_1409102 [Tricholoma matsutake]|nr:hypothetical protein L208DRAFT_1409102 [Tricholoma matsutake 945]